MSCENEKGRGRRLKATKNGLKIIKKCLDILLAI